MGSSEVEEKLPALILDHLEEGVLLTNPKAEIIYVNTHFTRVTGYGKEEVTGKNPNILSSGIHGEDFYRQMWQKILTLGRWEGEIWNRRKNGELYLEGAMIQSIQDMEGNPRYFMAVFRDITEKKRLEEKIHQLAHYDPVTHLPNESFLTMTLDRLIQERKDTGQKIAIVHLSVLQFKQIAESLGRISGNKLLRTIADQLKEIIGQEGFLGKWNGSQFILLLPISDYDEVISLVQKVLGEFHRHFSLDHHHFYLTLRAGISLYPQDGEEPELLFQKAEQASSFTREVRVPYLLYSSQFEEKIHIRLTVREYLRRALEEKQFYLHYQPIVDLHTGKWMGAEALVRWNHPVLGPLAPGIFIPVAEEMEFIGLLDEEVMRLACLKLREWEERVPPSFRMAINLSVQEFQVRDLVASVDRILQETGVSGEQIDLEITESALMQDAESSLQKLHALKERGIRISLDDFGTGYSSLQYLHRLPLDKLKIDRSFLKNINGDDRDRTIVKSVIDLGHNLGLKVLAEGIEEEEQFQLLKRLGSDEGQGNLFSPPIPGEEWETRFMRR
ncbi:conserved hypothetical protein [[Clostridium] ultunense Esp]|uniref:putative bifunctional diguanylate cyclase/phosphodiesterase n=1 Tax=Thermicanus aegyptius TaxID=94009 RepID=UPI0002B70D7B|nr:bifunctional diguanylate cyclase/phosphodiesterase [Thermicanus aegyptius]CCQ97722.1 conserved hypothetical protein [[Clostridium] ultunense Esp]